MRRLYLNVLWSVKVLWHWPHKWTPNVTAIATHGLQCQDRLYHIADLCQNKYMKTILVYPQNSKILTHWGWVMHICISKLTIIGSDNGLSPGRRLAIIWTNAGILLIHTLGTNFSEFSSEVHTFSFKKIHLKVLSAKWRQFCLSLNVLIYWVHQFMHVSLCSCVVIPYYVWSSVSAAVKFVALLFYKSTKQPEMWVK